MQLPNNHYFLKTKDAIDALNQPLKETFGLTSLVYQKNFLDGSEIRLSNQPQWIQHFYTNKLYQKSLFETHPKHLIKGRLIWASLTSHRPILDAARQFNIDHGITFIEPQADGCELFFLGTAPNQMQVMPRYLAHLDLLERFLPYFKAKARPLIAEARKHSILIPNKFNTAPMPKLGLPLDQGKFLKAISLFSFSAREHECIHYLLQGYTQKMIARELNISVRTVETHIEHIKQKANCSTKAELLRYLAN